MLQPNDTAPDFTVKDTMDNIIELKKYKDKKLLLSFFRYAGCPFCTLQFVELLHRYNNFHERGLEIIAFFQSAKVSIDSYIERHNPQFPIIPDPDKKIYDLYGVQTSVFGFIKTAAVLPGQFGDMRKNGITQGKIDGDLFLMPADFLIAPPNLTIKKVHYGTNASDKIPFVDIENFLQFD